MPETMLTQCKNLVFTILLTWFRIDSDGFYHAVTLVSTLGKRRVQTMVFLGNCMTFWYFLVNQAVTQCKSMKSR